MPLTNGFADEEERQFHFTKHVLKPPSHFGPISLGEYEALADAFLGGIAGNTTLECVRRISRDIIRWDFVTNKFGVLTEDGIIKTYFVADPAEHGLPGNLDYFNAECKKP